MTPWRRRLRALLGRPGLNHPLTAVLRGLVRVLPRVPDVLPRYLRRSGLVEARLPNGRTLRMWSRGDDDVAGRLYWLGWRGYEPETAEVFFDLASRARTTIDVGAHVGYFTLLAAHAGANGRVVALEPLPRVHDRLLHNVALNGLDNVTCLRTAAAERGGRAPFFHVGHGIPTSSSLSADFMASVVDEHELHSSQVDVDTVDEIVRRLGLAHVDLVKVDVEATEAAVLRGMRATLERDRPIVICEILETGVGEEIEQLLRPLGYRFDLLTGDGPVTAPHLRPHPRWRNHRLVPPVTPDA